MGLDDIVEGIASSAAEFLSDRRGESAELERVRRAYRRSVRIRAAANKSFQGDIAVLRAEVEYLSLVLTSLVAQLDAKSIVTREDLRSLMSAADDFDGQVDGRLPVTVLDELLHGDEGELEQPDVAPPA